MIHIKFIPVHDVLQYLARIPSLLLSGHIITMPSLMLAIVAFVATNLDDIILLTVFFSQVGRDYKTYQIVLGQYIGITALCLMSLPGFFGGKMIPMTWIGLLGIVPIVMGIMKLVELIRADSKDDLEEEPLMTRQQSSHNLDPNASPGWMARILSPQIYAVAAITVADGSDNIGIYVPLFATCTWLQLLLTVAVFYVLTGVWLYIGHKMSGKSAVADVLSKYGDVLVPVVLIGLGIYVLIENESYRLLKW